MHLMHFQGRVQKTDSVKHVSAKTEFNMKSHSLSQKR